VRYLVGRHAECWTPIRHTVVTSDVEGFGPGLLAAPPFQEIEADTPERAAAIYALRHGLNREHGEINLKERYDEMGIIITQNHVVTMCNDTGDIWHPKEELA
jgi:hypothetical protein